MEHLRGTVTDGRVANVRYRQDQLHLLHAALRKKTEEICDAIRQDASSSETEAEAEFFLAMDSVSKAYQTLNFDNSKTEEYFVKYGKDNLLRRDRVGLVAIRPCAHSRFYSILTPLAIAIAAGNCVLVEMETSDSKVDALLKQILSSLDRDLTFVSPKKLTESEILTNVDLLIDQTLQGQEKHSRVAGASTLRSIAVVDRSANIQQAAKDISKARLTPNNTSPYSPDLVIVNEFAYKEFALACLKNAEDTTLGVKMNVRKSSADLQLQRDISKAEKAGKVEISRSTKTDLTIVVINDRASSLVVSKVTGPYVVILPSTGVVDTVTSQRVLAESIATYLYADQATAKVLSEQLPSAASYVNQIPQHLLIGPVSRPHSLHPRYTTETMSLYRPQIISPTPLLPTAIANLREKAIKPLKPTGQRPGKAIGFFEQGILIGLGFTTCVVLPAAGFLAWTAVRKATTLMK